MKTTKNIIFLLSLTLLIGCQDIDQQSQDVDQQPIDEEKVANRLTLDEEKAGWKLLFNGNDLEGWRTYLGDAPGETWVVKDGAILLDVDENTTEEGSGDLITKEEFGNFELRYEWKISPGGNSGLFFHVREIEGLKKTYESGIEMQILDDDHNEGGKIDNWRAGSAFGIYAPEKTVTNPVGEYNKARILVQDENVKYWLNGHKIVEFEINSDDWKTRISQSVYNKDWKHYGQYPSGYIALQDHTDRVWFRNIKIRPVKANE